MSDLRAPIDLEDLLLRIAGPEDVGAICAYYAMPEVAKYQLFTAAQLQESIAAQEDPRFDALGVALLFAVVLKGEGRVIGDCSITIRDWESRQAEIAYTIHPEFWGRGYGTRSVRALIDFGFRSMNLHKIIASTDPRNEPSYRILERLGLAREAHFRDDFFIKGEWVDTYVYAMLRREWLQMDA